MSESTAIPIQPTASATAGTGKTTLYNNFATINARIGACNYGASVDPTAPPIPPITPVHTTVTTITTVQSPDLSTKTSVAVTVDGKPQ